MIRGLLCGVLVSLLLSGCATMFSDNQQQVALHSATGQNVAVRIQAPASSEYRATLPTVVNTRASSFNDLVVVVDDPCFEPLRYVVGKSPQPVYFLNLLNLHGLYIDYFSGRMWQYDQHVVVPTHARSAHTEDCTTKLISAAPLPSEQPPVIPLTLGDIPRPRRHELGIGMAPLRIHTRDENRGKFIHYNFQATDFYRFQLRVLLNSNYDYVFKEYWLDNYQTFFSAAIQVTPFPTQGIYFGAGVGAASLRLTYNVSYSNSSYNNYQNASSVELSGTSTPFFFELGWKSRGRINVNVFANISLQTLGLSPPPVHIDQEKLAQISNIDARNKAARQLKYGAEYSAVGLGVGWKF